MQFSIKHSLSLQEIKDVERLCAHSGNYDAFFETGEFPRPCFFLAVHQKRTVGFLSLLFGEGMGEITAVTGEAFRRRGIFSRLLSLAREANPSLPLVGTFSHAFDLSKSSLCRGLSHSEYLLALAAPAPDIFPGKGRAKNAPSLSRQGLRAAPDGMEALSEITVISPQKGTYLLLKDRVQVGEAHLEEGMAAGNLWGVEIKEPYRRKGYGSKLVSFVIRDHFSRCSNPLVLHVRSTNIGACRLYEKLGFAPAEKIDYYAF